MFKKTPKHKASLKHFICITSGRFKTCYWYLMKEESSLKLFKVTDEICLDLCATYIHLLVHSSCHCSRFCKIHEKKIPCLVCRVHQQSCTGTAALSCCGGLNSNHKEILQFLSPKKPNKENYSNLALHLCSLSSRR